MTTDFFLHYFQDPLWTVLLRLIINLSALYIIIFIVYSRFTKSKENMFPFFLMGTMIFLICILLKNAEMQMGMALGLFAIFSIMRFRTENLLTKNMAYLFAVIGTSVINALFDFPYPLRGTILTNSVIILTVIILEIKLSKYDKPVEDKTALKAAKKTQEKAEKKAAKNHEKKSAEKDSIKYIEHQVLYDNIGLLNQDRRDELIKDLSERTGIDIANVSIRKIDLINNNAELDVSYPEKSGNKNDLDA